MSADQIKKSQTIRSSLANRTFQVQAIGIAMDFIITILGTEDGYSGILTVVDKLSKIVWIIPIKSTVNSSEAAQKF